MIMNQEEMFRIFYNEEMPKGLNRDNVSLLCQMIPERLDSHKLQIEFLDKLHYEDEVISFEDYRICKTYLDLRKIHLIYEKDYKKGWQLTGIVV